MTPEQKVNRHINKIRAKMFTKLAKGMTVDVTVNCHTVVTVEVQTIRDPKTDWSYTDYRFNVKVIKGVTKVYQRDNNCNRIKDGDGRYVLVDTEMKSVRRDRVNCFNRDIRRVVERELEKYSPMFSINQWRLKCDKVQWF